MKLYPQPEPERRRRRISSRAAAGWTSKPRSVVRLSGDMEFRSPPARQRNTLEGFLFW